MHPSVKLDVSASGFIRRLGNQMKLNNAVAQLTDNSNAYEYRNLLLDMQNNVAKKYPQTSCGGATHATTPIGNFTYSYQRINLDWQGTDWLGLIHGIKRPDLIQHGAFKRSGMAALESVLDFFASRDLQIEVSPEPYYETLFKLRRLEKPVHHLGIRNTDFGNNADVLILDSSSRVWPKLPRQRGNIKLIILDSACVEANHPLISAIVNAGLALGVAVILVRSHMKLDCFGLDVGTFGSIIIIRPEATDQQITSMLNEYVDTMCESNFRDDAARLHEIYPWLGNNDFFTITNSIMAQTRMQSRRLLSACQDLHLQENHFRIMTYPHELYFSISLQGSHSDDGNDKKLSMAIAQKCQEAGESVFAGSTFGLYYTSVDDFNNSNDQNRRHVRICASITEHNAERVAASIADILLKR